MTIGEAVGALSEETRDAAPEIPWIKIKGLRNLLTHQYFHVRMDHIWEIVEASVPELRRAAERLSQPRVE